MYVIKPLAQCWVLKMQYFFSPITITVASTVTAIIRHGSLYNMILSSLSRLIVSHYLSVSVTQLRPAVCSSLKMPYIFMLMTPTFIFLAQNFPKPGIHLEI